MAQQAEIFKRIPLAKNGRFKVHFFTDGSFKKLFRSWPFCKWCSSKIIFIRHGEGKNLLVFILLSLGKESSEDVWKWKSEIWRDCTSLW